jgi:hypothetical protein
MCMPTMESNTHQYYVKYLTPIRDASSGGYSCGIPEQDVGPYRSLTLFGMYSSWARVMSMSLRAVKSVKGIASVVAVGGVA